MNDLDQFFSRCSRCGISTTDEESGTFCWTIGGEYLCQSCEYEYAVPRWLEEE